MGIGGFQSTVYYIEFVYGFKLIIAHRDPEKFAEALRKIYANTGEIIMLEIIKELYMGAGLDYSERKRWSWKDYFDDVRAIMKERKKRI